MYVTRKCITFPSYMKSNLFLSVPVDMANKGSKLHRVFFIFMGHKAPGWWLVHMMHGCHCKLPQRKWRNWIGYAINGLCEDVTNDNLYTLFVIVCVLCHPECIKLWLRCYPSVHWLRSGGGCGELNPHKQMCAHMLTAHCVTCMNWCRCGGTAETERFRPANTVRPILIIHNNNSRKEDSSRCPYYKMRD